MTTYSYSAYNSAYNKPKYRSNAATANNLASRYGNWRNRQVIANNPRRTSSVAAYGQSRNGGVTSSAYGGPDFLRRSGVHTFPGVQTAASAEQRNRDAFRNGSPTSPGGNPSGGSASLGSAGGASGLGAASAVRQYTPVSGGFTPGMGQYNANNEAYLARLKQLEGEYAKRMRWGITPEQFEYADWGGRGPMVDTARARIQGELDYSAPFWAQAAQQANRSFDLGREGMLGDRTEDLNAIGLQGQQDFGRLSNMAANMGLNVGQGALANQYGVMANTAAQQNNVSRDYAQMLAEAQAQRQGELGQIRAEEMGMRASAEGRAQTLADELAMQDFDQYMGLRGQAFGEHDAWQNMRMANEQQRLGTLMQQYQGREGLLGAQAGLNQDQRNFTWNDWWRNKDFNYTESWDEINNAYRNQADALARGTDNARYAEAQAMALQQQKEAAQRWALEQQIYKSQYGIG